MSVPAGSAAGAGAVGVGLGLGAGGRSGTGSWSRRGCGGDYAEEVDIADSKLASLVHNDTPDLRAGGQAQFRLRHAGPLLPATGLGDGDWPSAIDTVYLDVEDAARASRRDANFQVVVACRRNVDGVLQPLTCGHPTEVVAASGIGRCLDVDVCRAVRTAGVAGRGIQIRHVRSALIEILRLDRARQLKSLCARSCGRTSDDGCAAERNDNGPKQPLHQQTP